MVISVEKKTINRICKELKKLPENGLTLKQVICCITSSTGIIEPPLLPTDSNGILVKCRKEVSAFIITKSIRAYPMGKLIPTLVKIANTVYSELGHGWNEKVYQEAMKIELNRTLVKIVVSSEVPTSIVYKGIQLGDGVYVRTDIVLTDDTNHKLLLELKVSKTNLDKAVNQCKRYLRLGAIPIGLVINFPDKLYGKPIFKTVFP